MGRMKKNCSNSTKSSSTVGSSIERTLHTLDTTMPSTIVLDIEGTVCPISFVHDTLFPYALKKVRELAPQQQFPLLSSTNNSQNDELTAYLQQFPSEYIQSADDLINHVQDLTDRDVKASYWKSLQGFLWKSGYDNGEIQAPVYQDAIENIPRWVKQHVKVYIYSSGSVNAQKLLFKHCQGGIDLTSHFSGYFDTVNAGPKTESASYQSIARQIGVDDAGSILFLSDNHLETEAAEKAGWGVLLVDRPGNKPLPSGVTTPVIDTTDSVKLSA